MIALATILGKSSRKTVMASGLGLILLGASGPDLAAAELAKEGTFSLRDAWSGTVEGLSLGETRSVYIYMFKGVATNDAGEGLLHNTSMNCMGMGRSVRRATKDHGSCVYTDVDGDKIFDEWKDEGTLGVGGKGTGSLIGGTGKYAGIEGSYEYERVSLRPAAEGTFQGYTTRVEGTYKLP